MQTRLKAVLHWTALSIQVVSFQNMKVNLNSSKDQPSQRVHLKNKPPISLECEPWWFEGQFKNKNRRFGKLK